MISPLKLSANPLLLFCQVNKNQPVSENPYTYSEG